MKKFALILILLHSIVHAQQNTGAPFMDYSLSWDGISSKLKVNLTYTLSNKDSTVFQFGNPQFGGQLDIFKTLKDVNVLDNDSISISESQRQLVIFHHRKDRFEKHFLTYVIDGNLPKDKPTMISQTELFRPVIATGFLSMVNLHFTMTIMQSDDNPIVCFSWKKYPKNFIYFNSIHPEIKDPGKILSIQYAALNKMVFFTLSNNISVEKYNILNIPYYCITTNKDRYDNNLEVALKPFMENYFPSIHRFWNDTDFPFYFLSVATLLNNQKEIRGGGFAIRNGFEMKIGTHFGVWEKGIIAHETAHNWIGVKLSIGKDPFEDQWFGEGFNDYTSLINLVNSKIYDSTQFLHYLNNENLHALYSSPIRNIPNDSIVAKFWTDYDNYGKLPYRRGLIFAFYLDNKIRLNTNGKSNLRNLLLDLYALRKSKDSHDVITREDFINLGAKYMNKEELRTDFVNYIIKGKSILFTQENLIPSFIVVVSNGIPQIHLKDGSIDLNTIYHW